MFIGLIVRYAFSKENSFLDRFSKNNIRCHSNPSVGAELFHEE